MLGLYIHIPFCSAICNYCNFNRGLFDADLKSRYVHALVQEIEGAEGERLRPERGAGGERGVAAPPSESERGRGPASISKGRAGRVHADTIFFGGGTPSLLEPHEVARIINACRTSFDVASDPEVTLEANPESITQARLEQFRAAGVNRLSIGVQSFRESELRRLSRLHTVDRAEAAVGEARAAGFENLSLDLMMWLPEQRPADWLASVERAIALGPEHLSLYMLEVYPNAPLRDEMARAAWSQAPDHDVEEMYLTAMERLDRAGLEQYEVSNVARAGRRSRHNLKYWTDGEWLGFGCGAHSTRDGVRWKNVASTGDYIDRIGRGESLQTEIRRMSRDEQLGDRVITGLRLVDGIDLDEIAADFGIDLWDKHRPDLERFVEAGVLEREAARMRLTRRGMLLAHEVLTIFV
jgi:oxygen-independent coproporphyrinogen-3 oxidase